LLRWRPRDFCSTHPLVTTVRRFKRERCISTAGRITGGLTDGLSGIATAAVLAALFKTSNLVVHSTAVEQLRRMGFAESCFAWNVTSCASTPRQSIGFTVFHPPSAVHAAIARLRQLLANTDSFTTSFDVFLRFHGEFGVVLDVLDPTSPLATLARIWTMAADFVPDAPARDFLHQADAHFEYNPHRSAFSAMFSFASTTMRSALLASLPPQTVNATCLSVVRAVDSNDLSVLLSGELECAQSSRNVAHQLRSLQIALHMRTGDWEFEGLRPYNFSGSTARDFANCGMHVASRLAVRCRTERWEGRLCDDVNLLVVSDSTAFRKRVIAEAELSSFTDLRIRIHASNVRPHHFGYGEQASVLLDMAMMSLADGIVVTAGRFSLAAAGIANLPLENLATFAFAGQHRVEGYSVVEGYSKPEPVITPTSQCSFGNRMTYQPPGMTERRDDRQT